MPASPIPAFLHGQHRTSQVPRQSIPYLCRAPRPRPDREDLVFDFPGLTYEGTMSADGNSMIGVMTYAKRSLPLVLQRTKAGAEWAIPAAPAISAPMAADASGGCGGGHDQAGSAGK